MRHRFFNIQESNNVSEEITTHDKHTHSTGNINDYKFNDTQINDIFTK